MSTPVRSAVTWRLRARNCSTAAWWAAWRLSVPGTALSLTAGWDSASASTMKAASAISWMWSAGSRVSQMSGKGTRSPAGAGAAEFAVEGPEHDEEEEQDDEPRDQAGVRAVRLGPRVRAARRDLGG